MNKTYKNIFNIIFGTILVALSFYFVFRDISIDDLKIAFADIDYFWIWISIPIILLSHVVRAIRWRTLLKPILHAKSLMNLFSAVMVGYAINNIIPRGGEFVRPFIYARRENVSKSSVFATIIVERVIDIIYLLSLFVIAFLLLRERIQDAFPYLTTNTLFVMAAFILGGLVLLLLSIYTKVGEYILKFTIRPFSKTIYEKLNRILQSFLTGFGFIKTPSQYVSVILNSTFMWFLYALPLYMIFFSFNFDLGFGDALLLLIVVGIAVTIAPTPGSVGVYQLTVMEFLTNFYGISSEQALAYGIVANFQNIAVQLVFGSIFVYRENLKRIPKESDMQQEVEPTAEN